MELLKLSEVKKELPFKTHNVNLFWNVYDIIERNRAIDFDVFLPTKGFNLQRPFCWTLSQKQELIISVMKGRYIPKLCVLIDKYAEEPKYQIIDGKQRLNAMLSFLREEFPIVVNGVEYYAGQLDKDALWAIKGYSPVCEAAYFYEGQDISDEAKIEWFSQINFAGTPQDEQHLKKLLS